MAKKTIAERLQALQLKAEEAREVEASLNQEMSVLKYRMESTKQSLLDLGYECDDPQTFDFKAAIKAQEKKMLDLDAKIVKQLDVIEGLL